MQRVHTVPMQEFSPIAEGPFKLESYEVGWATDAKAMVFVQEEYGPTLVLNLRAQISVDGQRRIDSGREFELITALGGYFLNPSHFGEQSFARFFAQGDFLTTRR